MTANLYFGTALIAMKAGRKVARKGWNGKGMWLALVPAMHPSIISPDLDVTEISPWIGMKTADNKFVPWQPSQTDMLAEDWEVIE